MIRKLVELGPSDFMVLQQNTSHDTQHLQRTTQSEGFNIISLLDILRICRQHSSKSPHLSSSKCEDDRAPTEGLVRRLNSDFSMLPRLEVSILSINLKSNGAHVFLLKLFFLNHNLHPSTSLQ